MADNTTLNPGVGGDTFAADDIGGIKFQRVKLTLGADGANDGDVSASNPIPMVLSAAIPAGANVIGAVTQSGAPWSQNITQVGGVSLALGQALMSASIPVAIASNQTALPVTQSGTWTIQPGNTPNTSPWLMTISQGGNSAAVKAATVAAVAADPSLVVALSPNSPIPTGSNVIGSLVANQSINNTQINGSAIVTVATGVQKVGVSDSTGNSFLSAANALNSTGAGLQAVQVVAQFDDVSPTVITENQFGNLRMSTNRNLYTTLRDAAGNERGLSISAQNAAAIAGDVAAAAADAGSPIKIGGQARITNPTAVADGQRVNAMFDKLGRQVVVIGQIRELRATQRTQIVNSTAETTILAAGGANIFHDVYFLIVTNASAQQVNVSIRDATTGTIRFTISLAAYGGAVIQPPRAHPQSAANNNWTAQLSVNTVTVNITVMADKNL